jgi:hypothetical protein
MNDETKPLDTAENFDTNAEAASEQQIAEQQTPHCLQINGNDAPVAQFAEELAAAGKASPAAAIMGDPAAAAGLVAKPTPEVQIKRTLDCLPGLVGAIDHAIKDQTGKHQPFVLMIFAEGTALHAANFDAKVAQNAVIELASRWDTGADEAQCVQPDGTTVPVNALPDSDAGSDSDAGNPSGVTH